MVAVWTQTLMSAAEISNFFSALAVVICFMCMVIFIMRTQGMHLGSSVVHVAPPTPVQVNYQKVEVPFMCHVNSNSGQNLNEGEIEIKVSSDVACDFLNFWCVSSARLKELIQLPWDQFEEKLRGETFLNAKKSDSCRSLDPRARDDAHVIRLSNDRCSEMLGPSPRSDFPLVVFLVKKQGDGHEADVGALLSIIHLSDELCPMPSAIIYQYLKQYSGQLTQLQTLFTQREESSLRSGPREESNQEFIPLSDLFEREESEEGACVICRVVPPTRALLPCRHVCICVHCFPKLEFCPLCRERICAFFVTNPLEEEKQERLAAAEDENPLEANTSMSRHRSFLNNMNSVLNSVLGLRED